MAIMNQLGITINAKAIALGMLKLMRESDEKNVVLIQFGMLPSDWMYLLDMQMREVVKAKLKLVDSDNDERTVVVRPGSDEAHIETFSMKALIAEMVHEVVLGLYDSVEMMV